MQDGLAIVLSIGLVFLPSLCPFHKKMIIFYKMSSGITKQIIHDLVFIMYSLLPKLNSLIRLYMLIIYIIRNLKVGEFSFLHKPTTKKSLVRRIRNFL